MKTILDDLTPGAVQELLEQAALRGAFHMLIWLIAFYEAKRHL